MEFNQHKLYAGTHSFLSASQPHWTNWDDDKLLITWDNKQAAALGTELHDLASKLIKHKRKQQKTKDPFNMFVNDAIGYKMSSEVLLWYSRFAYGTTDAISYNLEKGKMVLRISDYKSGIIPGKMLQLYVYAAYFCLEYGFNPEHIDTIIFRIYQHDNDNNIVEEYADRQKINDIMLKVVRFSEQLEQKELEG